MVETGEVLLLRHEFAVDLDVLELDCWIISVFTIRAYGAIHTVVRDVDFADDRPWLPTSDGLHVALLELCSAQRLKKLYLLWF